MAKNLTRLAPIGRGVQALSEKVVSEKDVKPIYSTNQEEARLRVKKAYKAWMRYVPLMCHEFETALVIFQPELLRAALKRKFVANKGVRDLRVVDQLAHRAEIELINTRENWNQSCHLMSYLFADSVNEKPEEFLDKFFAGKA